MKGQELNAGEYTHDSSPADLEATDGGHGTTGECQIPKACICISVTNIVGLSLLFAATVVLACFFAYKLRKVKRLSNEPRPCLDAATLASHNKETTLIDDPELSDSYESLTYLTDSIRMTPRAVPAAPAAGGSNDSIYSSVNSYASINELSKGRPPRRNSTVGEDQDDSDPARPPPCPRSLRGKILQRESDIPPPPPSPPAPICPPRTLKPTGRPPLKTKVSEPLPLPPSELPEVFDLDAPSSPVQRAGGTLRSALRSHRIFRSRLIDSSLESLVD